MQQVKVDIVCTKPPQAPFTSPLCPFIACIARQHLADDKRPVATVAHSFAHEFLRVVHLSGINQRQPQVDTPAQGLYLFARPTPHLISALTKRTDLLPVSEYNCSFHRFLSSRIKSLSPLATPRLKILGRMYEETFCRISPQRDHE